MKLLIKKGATSVLACIFIQDSSSTVGAGLSGLVFNTSGLVCYRARSDDGNAGGTAVTLATATLGTWATGGFVEKDATHMKGVYEIGITNLSLATGSDYCVLYFSGATNMAPCVLEIQLVAFDPDAATNLGLSALPTANPGAAGGLFIAGTNAATTITTAGGSALTLSSTGTNGSGLLVSGNGTGDGIQTTGGATGRGIHAIGGATSGAGIRSEGTAGNAIALELAGQGSATALSCTGGATGPGAKFIGGGTSGDGIDITTTSGDGLSILPTAGNGIVATANGTSKHGAVITGGTAGTSDGVKAVAGTGGVDIRGNITGNITGTLATVTTLTNLPAITSNWLTAAGIAASALNGKGDWLLAASYTAPPTTAQIATGVWTDTTAGDFTVGLSVGKSVMNGVTLGTGLTVNILTNLPAIPNNWLTAAGIAASALNGKGDWLLAGSYTTPPTAAAIATGVWTDTTAGDFTVGLSVGKSMMNGVTLGTGLTVNALTTNNDKTGYSLAAGQKVDVDTIKTNPVVNAGTVTFPTTATLASTTNLTAGTIATVSGNVNGSVGSVTGAVGSVTGAVGSVTGNVGGNVTGSVGSVVAAVSVTSSVKKNQALAGFGFTMTDSTNHNPTAGLTVAATRSLDGAAFAGCANAVAEIANGEYKIDLAATDLNANTVMLRFTAVGGDDLSILIVTQP